MRILKRLIVAALVVVLLVVVGVFVAVQFVDTNRYRDVLAEMAEDATGREVRMGGNLRFKLLPLPSLVVNDIAFSNAAWAKHQPDMLRIKHLRAEVELWPLFAGRVVVRRFVAIEPEIYLQSDSEGRGNWVLGDGEAQSVDSSAKSGAIPRVIVDAIQIERARFEFLDGKSEQQTVVAIEEMSVGAEQPGDRSSLSLRGSYQDLPVTVDGKIGRAGAILANRPIEIDVKGRFGEADFSLAGSVGRPLEVSDVRLDALIDSATTKPLTDAFGADIEELGPLRLELGIAESGGSFRFDPIQLDARPRNTDATITGSIENFSLGVISGQGSQSAPMSVDLDGEFGKAVLHIAGDIGNTIDGGDSHVDASFKTESTRTLTEIAGIEFEEFGPLSLSVALRAREGRVDFDDIALSARPRGIDASATGSVNNLLLGGESHRGEPARIDLKGELGEARYSVNGDVGNPFEAKDVNLVVALQVNSTKPLTDLAGAEIEEVGPVDITANVRTRGEMTAGVESKGRLIEIQDFVARVSKSDLSGSAVLDTRADAPSATARLHAKVINLAEFLPEKKGEETATKTSPEDRIFSDKPLPLGVLKKANGQVEFAVDKLYMRKLTLEKVKLDATLDNGRLVLQPAAYVAGGQVDARLDVDAYAESAIINTRVEANQVSIGELTDAFEGEESSKGLPSQLRMSLRGEGDSMRALMGGLEGDLRLEMGAGELRNDHLDRVGGDLLTQIFGAVVPLDEKKGVTAVNCGVIRFKIEDGAAVADQTLVLETEKVLAQGGGIIDLRTEYLDLGAKLAAREGVGIGAGTLSSLMRLKGPLAQPELATDLEGTAMAGARIGVAVVTVGLSLLAESVYGQLSAHSHPCRAALGREIEVTPGEFRKKSAGAKKN